MELIRSPLKLTASSLNPFSPFLKTVTCFIPCLAHGKLQYLLAITITPVLLPEESHGQRSLAGYNPWGHKESDTTEGLTRAHICSPCACSFCINRYNEATEGLVSNTSIKDFYESSMFNMKQNLKDFFAGMNDILFQFNNG